MGRSGDEVGPAMRPRRHPNIEIARAVAILVIFGYHFGYYWQLTGGRLGPWNGPQGRLERLVAVYGGTFGVSVFIMISGLVLVAAMTRAPATGAFYRRRLLRIYPLFWWIALPTMLILLILGRFSMDRAWEIPFWLSGSTIVYPGHLWPISAPWWFITLIVQIYLAFPLLWRLYRRVGPAGLLAISFVVNVLCLRLLGPPHAPWGHDVSQYLLLAFVASRLVELSAGICLGVAYWGWSRGERPSAQLALTLVVGVPAALFIMQRIDYHQIPPLRAYFFVAVMALPFVAAACRSRAGSRLLVPLVWLGGISYAFYLAHSVLIMPVIVGLARLGVHSGRVALVVSLAVALAVSAGFHYSYAVVAPRMKARLGRLRVARQASPARAG